MICRGKTHYLSRREARGALRTSQNRGGGYLRAYPCSDCDAWHLTCLTKKEHKAAAKRHAEAFYG